MKTVLIAVVLLSACVGFEPGEQPIDAPTDVIDAELVADTAGIEESDAAPSCTSAACRDLVAINATYPPTRPVGGVPSGVPWDADGSLPEPVMEIRVNGALVGVTVTPPTFLYFPGTGTLHPSWTAKWRETVATVALVVGDAIEMNVLDAEERYLITRCSFKVSAAYLSTYHEINCLLADANPVGSITVGIGTKATP